SGMGVSGIDSTGATLLELAELLQEAGAVTAVNLDGGGSTQAYFKGGQAVVPGDRRGMPQCVYQRMIPSVGVVK
ncbi:MAG: phosphodiester glycosidase family protein, partial [Chloroflexi bacterium]|nr:phosphodiester glycosidase family protein [Chloroflexota bacterium]